jgi:hypothetical protein
MYTKLPGTMVLKTAIYKQIFASGLYSGPEL